MQFGFNGSLYLPKPSFGFINAGAGGPAPYDGNFGNDTIGATSNFLSGGEYYMTKFRTPVGYSFVSTDIYAYSGLVFTGPPQDCRFALWSTSADEPDAVLVQASGVMNEAMGVKSWLTQPFVSSLDPDTLYCLTFWGSQHFYADYNAGSAGQSIRKYSVSFPTFQTPYNGLDSEAHDYEPSIYLAGTFTPV